MLLIDLRETCPSQIRIDTYTSSKKKKNGNYINIDKNNKLLSKEESIGCKKTSVIYGSQTQNLDSVHDGGWLIYKMPSLHWVQVPVSILDHQYHLP